MIRFVPAAILATATLAAGAASAAEIFTPPNGFWLDPVKYNHTLYGPTDSFATWHATQWQSPGPALPAFANGLTASSNQRVVWSGSSWEMALNGHNLACGVEFGGFFEPNIASTYAGYPAAGGNSAPLSSMISLHHRLGVTYKYYAVVDNTCTNQGNFLTSFVLKNTVDKSSLYYQIAMVYLNSANPNPWPNGYWWEVANQNNWGFSDGIQHYGGVPPALGHRAYYDIDLLPRIKQIIAMSTLPDKNLSHWVVNSNYHGVHVWGHITATADFDSFSLDQE